MGHQDVSIFGEKNVHSLTLSHPPHQLLGRTWVICLSKGETHRQNMARGSKLQRKIPCLGSHTLCRCSLSHWTTSQSYYFIPRLWIHRSRVRIGEKHVHCSRWREPIEVRPRSRTTQLSSQCCMGVWDTGGETPTQLLYNHWSNFVMWWCMFGKMSYEGNHCLGQFRLEVGWEHLTLQSWWASTLTIWPGKRTEVKTGACGAGSREPRGATDLRS